MGANSGGTGERRRGRRWHFGTASFDEASWTLLVDGQRVALEMKPMALLHELLLRAGDVVTKDELLSAAWPDLSVVEASLPTAIRKLRQALGDEDQGSRIIETVPRIGYRLAAPVTMERLSAPIDPLAPAPAAAPAVAAEVAPPGDLPAPLPKSHRADGWRQSPVMAAAALLVIGATGLGWALLGGAAAPSQAVMQREAMVAIRKMDVDRVQGLLDAGWNPNIPIDEDGDRPLTMVLNICEWNPAHDRNRLLLLTRTMLEGGADIMARNVFGDTAYSIAKAPRYCGPDHPVTRMLHAQCYNPPNGPGDRCLATYELARRRATGTSAVPQNRASSPALHDG